MKPFSSTIFAACMVALASSSVLAMPLEERASTKIPCKAYGKPGLLKIDNYEKNQINGTVLAEGTFSAATNKRGNENLIVQFEECNFKGYNYKQGSSRNHDGSMGAPVEYFGKIVEKNSKSNCLTASSTNPSQSISFRYQPCSTKDDDERLQQIFAYQIQATGTTTIAYIGAKNTTKTPYKGGYNWTVGPKFSPVWPQVIEATTKTSNYGLSLVSPSH